MKRLSLFIVPALLLGWGMNAWAEEIEFGKLKSKTPDSWKSEKVKGLFRAFQFVVPKADDDRKDAEVVIFYFERGAGSAEDNIKRQQKAFIPAEGQKIVSSLDNFKVGGVEVAYLDISGTYVTKNPPFDPKAKEERFPNYRMLYVYFPADNGLYTVRLVGPAKTVEQSKKGFEDFIKSFK